MQGHIPEKEEPGLKPAVSSEPGPWRHQGLPTAVGWWHALVSLCMDTAGVRGERSAAQRYPGGALWKEGTRARGPQEMTSLPWP